MQRLDMQTQKKRDNYNKVCVGFSISVLIFAKTVKQLQIQKTKLNKKLMELLYWTTEDLHT